MSALPNRPLEAALPRLVAPPFEAHLQSRMRLVTKLIYSFLQICIHDRFPLVFNKHQGTMEHCWTIKKAICLQNWCITIPAITFPTKSLQFINHTSKIQRLPWLVTHATKTLPVQLLIIFLVDLNLKLH